MGLRKENTPANNASLWTRYDLTAPSLRGLGVGFGVQYQGSRIPWFSRAFELPAFTVADAALYYRVKAIQLAVNANNLFNTTYWVGAYDYFRLFPGAPRNVMVNVTYLF